MIQQDVVSVPCGCAVGIEYDDADESVPLVILGTSLCCEACAEGFRLVAAVEIVAKELKESLE